MANWGESDVKELLLQAEDQVNRHIFRTVNNGNTDVDAVVMTQPET